MRSTPREDPITVSGVTNPPQGQYNAYPPPHDPSGGWQQPGYYTAPHNPPPPPKKGMSNAAILWIVFGSIGALLLLAGIGALLPSPEPKAATSPGIGTPAPYTPENPASPTAPTTAAKTTAPAAGPLTSFADGTHEVGTGPNQIPPGTYTAVVPDAMFDLCFWSRLRGFSGEGKDIIAIGSGNAGDKQRVTIGTSDKGFETKGCGTWTKS